MPIALKEPSMTETTMKNRRQAVIIDHLGLHLRPAAKLVNLANTFRSDIRVVCKGNTANAKSILDLFTLGAECGTMLDFVAHGTDAEEAVNALAELIGDGLDGSVARTAAA
jgi:phosphocarrier protein HPr